jgi:D-cysteine desulfhydrase
MRCVLFLWTIDPSFPAPLTGNLVLCRLAGATIHLLQEDQRQDRHELMRQETAQLERRGAKPYVIPEGGSNGLGALGYVEAMREVRQQLDLGLGGGKRFDLVVQACGSGGTSAGTALGAAHFHVAQEVLSIAVSGDAEMFHPLVTCLIDEARAIVPELSPPANVRIDDTARGPAYGVASPEQRSFLVDMARSFGLMLDPVYSGKALFGLAHTVQRDGALLGKRVLFIHTGGLPGLLAQGEAFASDV